MSDLQQHSTTTGLDPNVAGALAYLLGPLTGIAFLVLERDNRFVRFHAAQSIVVGVGLIVAGIALSVIGVFLRFIPVLGWIAGSLLSFAFALGSFAFWLTLMWRAFQGEEWEVPGAGRYSRQLLPGSPTA